MTKLLNALTLALCLHTPHVVADAPPAQSPAGPGLPINAFLREDELRLLFDYARDAMIAAMKGERQPMPPELRHALARAQERLMRQGNAAMRQMIEMIQNELDRALEEVKPPAPEPQTERTGL